MALHAGALLALAPTLWRLAPPPRVLALSLAPPVVVGLRVRAADRGAARRAGRARRRAADRRRGSRRRGSRACGCGWPWQGLVWAPARGTGLATRAVAEASGAGRGAEPGRRGACGVLALGARAGARRSSPACRGPARRWPRRGRSGYSRAEASRLSFGVAGPVLAGATALKAWRGRPWTHWRALAAGAAAAFVATRVALRAFGLERREPLWPYAAERGWLLAGAILGRAVPSSAVSTDAYARSGVDQHAADRAVAALVGVLQDDRSRARRRAPCSRPATTPRCSRWRRTSGSRSGPTASARS